MTPTMYKGVYKNILNIYIAGVAFHSYTGAITSLQQPFRILLNNGRETKLPLQTNVSTKCQN